MKWIISNLKNELVSENYRKRIDSLSSPYIKMVICPHDRQLSEFHGENYFLGSQDVGYPYRIEDLKKMGIRYSIVGHSDRRRYSLETNQEIHQKIIGLLASDICPILCIGEELKSDSVNIILGQQLEECLTGITHKQIMIAYEPVWAIGSGKIPSLEMLEKRMAFIQKTAVDILGVNPILLYGGSVNESTIHVLEKIKLLDGYLIGSASLNISQLEKIIEVIK